MKRYERIQPFKHPEFDRTWSAAIRHERYRIGVFVVMFVVGAIVMPSYPLAGYLLMFAATLSLIASLVAGRYLR